MPTKSAERTTETDFTAPADNAVVVAQPEAPLPAPSQPTTMLDIIERASRDPSVDIDKLERLIAMKERMESRQAQVEFDNALRDAQEEMKAIRADLSNSQTRSNYASYAQLDKAIRPIYVKHGFAVTFNTGDAPKTDDLRVLATLSHRGGHRQDYKIDMPADGKGAKGGDVMTRTHATGAAASYGQRYLYKLMFNLAVGEVDDDGNGADVESLATGPRDADGNLLSTYSVNKGQKAKDFADNLVQTLNHADKEVARDVWRENWKAPKGSRVSPLAWLQLHAPEQFTRVETAFNNAVS